jgi:sugar phosphate isomerase/epimerase
VEEIGIQLYTLRAPLSEDVAGTLAQVAEIGYQTVEFAGLYGLTPGEMRTTMDAVGLRAVSSHAGVSDIRGDWASFLEGAQQLGQDFIFVPSIPESERTPEGLRKLAEDFNRAGEIAGSGGLHFGYHNHAWEFAALPDGTVPMDLLLERTEPRLVDWQMDIFWVVDGGGDPMAYLESQAGRVTSVHVKDRTPDGRMVDVGKGVIDFATILPRAEELGMLHAFVEHDTPDAPIESVRYSFNALSALKL